MLTVEQINELRRKYCVNYEMISDSTGVPLSTVQKVLGGVTKSPRRETLEALSNYFEKEHNRVKYTIPGETLPDDIMVMENVSAECFDSYGGYRTKHNKKYTLNEFDNITKGEARLEMIDGVVYYLASPNSAHQIILMEIAWSLKQHINSHNGKCKVFVAPYDVYYDKDDDNRVQPDIIVYCRDNPKGAIIPKGFWGAPDFICEIVSPSTSSRDYYLKRNLYRESGVKEYWIVDYSANKITVENYMSDKGQDVYSFDDKIPVAIYNGDLVIDFADIKAACEDVEE